MSEPIIINSYNDIIRFQKYYRYLDINTALIKIYEDLGKNGQKILPFYECNVVPIFPSKWYNNNEDNLTKIFSEFRGYIHTFCHPSDILSIPIGLYFSDKLSYVDIAAYCKQYFSAPIAIKLLTTVGIADQFIIDSNFARYIRVLAFCAQPLPDSRARMLCPALITGITIFDRACSILTGQKNKNIVEQFDSANSKCFTKNQYKKHRQIVGEFIVQIENIAPHAMANKINH